MVEVRNVYEHEPTGCFDSSELALLIVSFILPIITLFFLSSFFFVCLFHPSLRKDSDYHCADVLHNGIRAASGAVN